MVSWERSEHEAPELARGVRACFEAATAHVLASLRRDGAPRVSGTEVDVDEQGIRLGSLGGAVKALGSVPGCAMRHPLVSR
ncbi:hypothetical protein [Amycolatopsis antarctica]|uniref:hypothetical protein n=1 Tax=Amycolatopsis antarctica TaxID=1854586 RepID=UPI001F0A2994|nr:hypothetical protein [Amycolatopsis antarctica]